MKARTKLQHRVFSLSHQHREVTEAQKEWAFRVCLEHKGYATKSRVFCLDCGNSFSPDLVKRKRAFCPRCNTKLNVEQTKKIKDKQKVYFGITEIIEDFQVIRIVDVVAYYRGGKEAQVYYRPIIEHWILPDGKREVIGYNRTWNYYQDSWGGDWAIRNKNRPQFNVYPFKYHPSSKFKPEYRKYGINANLRGLTALDAINIIPNEPKAETLLKAKRYDILSFFHSKAHLIRNYWASIKICLRNNYRPSDVGIWFDYLDLLKYFRMDIHNAKYVCPPNLKSQHDRLVRKKRERQIREINERKRREVAQAQIKYSERIKGFVGLQFTDGNIVVKVLETVKEFEEEGDTLKHCVFTNDYYDKEDSLILSARINGVPVETMEVILSKMKIEQSRGLKNEPSEYNKKIVRLVKKNLPKIKKLYLQKTG